MTDHDDAAALAGGLSAGELKWLEELSKNGMGKLSSNKLETLRKKGVVNEYPEFRKQQLTDLGKRILAAHISAEAATGERVTVISPFDWPAYASDVAAGRVVIKDSEGKTVIRGESLMPSGKARWFSYVINGNESKDLYWDTDRFTVTRKQAIDTCDHLSSALAVPIGCSRYLCGKCGQEFDLKEPFATAQPATAKSETFSEGDTVYKVNSDPTDLTREGTKGCIRFTGMGYATVRFEKTFSDRAIPLEKLSHVNPQPVPATTEGSGAGELIDHSPLTDDERLMLAQETAIRLQAENERLRNQLQAAEDSVRGLREALSTASANMYAVENHLAEHPTDIDAGYLAKIFQISHTKISQAAKTDDLRRAAKEEGS